MTVGGPVQPPASPGSSGPPAPLTPDGGRQPRRRRRSGPVALAAVVGLLVGAAVVGGVWWARASPVAAPPPPIPISLATLPTSVLGEQRNDLAAAHVGGGTGAASAKDMAEDIRASIQEFRATDGAPGITGGYGAMAGKISYTLTIRNAAAPPPPASSDTLIAHIGALNSSIWLSAPGSATTTCVTAPGTPVVLGTNADVAAAKRKVLDGLAWIVTCTRTDWARNLSVVLTGSSVRKAAATAKAQSAAMAAAVDRIWGSLDLS